jgi:dipeptidase
MDLVRLCLERSSTADQALDALADLLAAHGQGGVADRARDIGYFSSFLIADGRAGWVVETCGRSWWAAPVPTQAAISNRISLRAEDVVRCSPDLKIGFDPQSFLDPDAVVARADRRLACTLPALDAATTPGDLVAVLRHHGSRPWGRPGSTDVEPPPPSFDEETAVGISVCMHLRGDVATTAAMVAELPADGEPGRAWVAVGSPCVSVFVPVFPPSIVPPELATPALWHRFERLRQRVEDDGDALAEVRAATAPLEAELWAEAEDAREAAQRQRFAESIGPRLDAVLHSLSV